MVLNQTPGNQAWSSVGMAPRVLNLTSKYRSHGWDTHSPPHSGGKIFYYPLKRKLGGFWRVSERGNMWTYPWPRSPWGLIGEIEVYPHSFYLDTMWRCTQLHAPLTLPWERNPIPIKSEVWWAPEPVWAIRRRKRYLFHNRIRTLGGPARSH